MNGEFLVDVRAVGLYRLGADAQLLRHCFRGEPAYDEVEYFAFAQRELGQWIAVLSWIFIHDPERRARPA